MLPARDLLGPVCCGSVQSAAYGSAEGALTKALLDDTIKTKLAEHERKAAFSAA